MLLLFKLSEYYLVNDTLKARQLTNEIVHLSEKLNYPKGTGMAFHRLGDLEYQNGAYELAYQHYFNAIGTFEEYDHQKELATTRIALSRLYKDQGYLSKALEQALAALDNFRNIGDTLGLISSNNVIGTYFQRRKEFTEAEKHYKENLLLLTFSNNFKQEAITYQNIGNLYARTGKYKPAIDFYTKAESIFKSTNNLKSEARILNNIGNVYFEMDHLNKALVYYKKSLQLKKELDNRLGIAYSFNNIATIYDAQEKYPLALDYYQKALEIAIEVESLSLQQSIWENMALSSERDKNYEKALEYTKNANRVMLQLAKEEKERALTEMEVKYESGKKEQENRMLRQNQELQKELVDQRTGERNILLMVVLVILFLLGGIFIAYSKYRKANSILETQKAVLQQREQEKVLLLKELHHRVKNNLQVISSLLSLQSFRLTDKEAVAAVKEGQRRVEAMSLIHKNLYHKEQLTHLNIADYTKKLLEQVMQSYGRTESEIQLNFAAEKLWLEVDQAIPLGLILNEVFSNAFKHAFQENKHPKLDILLSQKGNGQLEIAIHDNGPGIDEAKVQAQKTSFGLQLIQSLSKQLRANWNMINQSGTMFTLSVQLKNALLNEANLTNVTKAKSNG